MARGSRAGATSLLVARQPIFDRAARVVAYELLARRSLDDATWSGEDEDSRTTSRVIRQAFLEMDVWSLTEGLPAFINFTRELLLDGLAESLPSELAVVEILETIEPDPEVAAACDRLRAAGYRVALDDVVAEDPRLALLAHVDVVKIDFGDTNDAQRRALLSRCRDAGVQVLAEKVETPAQHAQARQLGCDLFQGYFFQKPAIVGARQLEGTRLAHLQLRRSATSRRIDRDAVGNVLARDRYAARRFRDVVEAEQGDVGRQPSARAVLDRLDDEQLMRVITLLVVLWLGESHPRPLRETALIRARFCEQLTALVEGNNEPVDAWDGYLTGCCSLLDALVDEPLADVLDRIQLPAHLVDACLHHAGTMGSMLALVRAYEHGHWTDVLQRATALGVGDGELGPLYLACLSQVRALLDRLDADAAP